MLLRVDCGARTRLATVHRFVLKQLIDVIMM